MADGLYQSAIIFFVPYLIYGSGAAWSSSGRDTDGLYDFGTTVAAIGVVSANLYVGVNTRYWTVITAIVLAGSTILVYLWIPIYSALAALHYNGEVGVIYPTFFFWATTVFTVFLAVGPRWITSTIRQSYFPRDKDIIREAWISGTLKTRLGVRRLRDGPESEEPSFVSHIQKNFSSPDERGNYQPAAMASPRKEYALSPLASESSTPRNPFSYPPHSPNTDSFLSTSPSPGSQATIPPPLLIGHSPGLTHTSPVNSSLNGLVTPISQISYTSPTTLEAFNLISAEIKRLNRTSTEIEGAAMSSTPSENERMSSQSSSVRRTRATSDRRPSTSPMQAHATVPPISLFGVSPGEGLSTVHQEMSIPGSNQSTDFSESRLWEEQADRRSSAIGLGGDLGYAV